ncbi:CCA tRNA nucleotidyltransferase [Salinarchaeum laminariae]|uniref:CCA tRNA nucleotidyltransferase n=1 Tax=Salinarchaeum laminariae TaxID=869888 RepID=UPI0020BEF911|nr:CCA tRNA nucleotidyltransferase [Salinarchaeum laminariae]
MSDDLDAVLERARTLVTPDEGERAALRAATERLRARAVAAIEELPVEADVVLVGSTARSTWLPGERDVDIFLQFPADLDRDALEEHGLAVGHAVLGDGHEEYAEHPYVTGAVDEGDLEDVDVDVVPCYDLDAATDIRSAVDRTPFHTEYVRRQLDDDLATEVRLAKAFATGIGIYGSDLRTRGLSGYLTELLALEYGGFREFLEAAADWHPPVQLDPNEHGTATFEDPLVMIDPTDPERNVAAVCSAANVARLQHHARLFLERPDVEAFETQTPTTSEEAAIDSDALRSQVERRGTTPIAIRFTAPDLVEDDLYPQLRASLGGIVGLLERLGFDVLRSTTAVADGDAILLVELEVVERPAIERHEGPPVHVREHAEAFYETYATDDSVYGPFVDGDRYVVERPRDVTHAVELLDSDAIFDGHHGAGVERRLESGYDLLTGPELTELLPTFADELAAYFDPEP